MSRKTRASAPTQKQPAPAPVVAVKACRAALDAALKLAGGERRRLVIEPDGSVLVVNRP